MASGARALRLRVSTYNVLSSHLAEPSWFTACNARDLAVGTRRQRLLARLGAETEQRSVLCLQEVSSTWYEAFGPFFQQRNYTLLARLYGTPFNDTMGVAIAVPNERFILSQYRQCHVARTLPRLPQPERRDGAQKRAHGRPAAAQAPSSERPAAPSDARAGGGAAFEGDARPGHGALASPLQWLRRVLHPGAAAGGPGEGRGGGQPAQARPEASASAPPAAAAAQPAQAEVPEAWRLASRAKNWLQFAVLECRETGRQVGVANYHMPCTHWCKAAMSIHAWRAAHQIDAWARDAGGVPYLLAADLNACPTDGAHTLLTTGALPADHAHAPPPHPVDPAIDLRAIPQPLRSAYAAVHGAEPAFTNVALTKDMDPAAGPFVETLDYLFTSPGVRAASADAMPARDTIAALSFPTETEPSDHLMLSAEVEVGQQ